MEELKEATNTVKESIINCCVDLDTLSVLDDKKVCADTIKVLAEAYATMTNADTAKVQADNAHVEEMAKIENQKTNDALDRAVQTYKIQSENDIQRAKLEVEKDQIEKQQEASDKEIEVKAEDLEQKRKDKLASDIIAFVGTATTACVGIAGIIGHRHDVRDLMQFEANGKIEYIPVSTAFKTFFKTRK